MSDFDEVRYQQLMASLEAVEIRKSKLSDDLRIDSQYFLKAYLREDARRRAYHNVTLGSQAFVTDGPHGYHEVDEESPIAMLTAKNARGWFASRQAADTISSHTHRANLRSSLQVKDIVLSTRGTVGLCAIVDETVLPANIDQDVARIALQADAEVGPEYLLAYLNSRFGQDWIRRNAAGMVQQGLSLAKVREIPIPRLSSSFQDAIRSAVSTAFTVRKHAMHLHGEAEKLYLEAMGLVDWSPPEPLSYVRLASEVRDAGRLDSQFFSPRVQALIERLSSQGRSVGDVARQRKCYFEPVPGEPFEYIEIGDVTQEGKAFSREVDGGEAPSRAVWRVKSGDVITTTVRPIRRLSALVEVEQDNSVCSSGFVVLEPSEVEPELLLTYLRLPVICELMDLHTTASMYPTITSQDVLSIPITIPSETTSELLVQSVRKARLCSSAADRLLDRVTLAVETALEHCEADGLRHVSDLEGLLRDGQVDHQEVERIASSA